MNSVKPNRLLCARFNFTNTTSQDKSVYIISNTIVFCRTNQTYISPASRIEKSVKQQFDKPVLNATSCQTHATFGLTLKL